VATEGGKMAIAIPDGRMLWLRELDALGGAPASHVLEAELASEVLVPGLLEYAEKAIRLRPVTYAPDHTGLYKYVLQLKCAERAAPEGADESPELLHAGTSDGYVFATGAMGELAALLSLITQARVFLLSVCTRRAGDGDVAYKTEFVPLRVNHGVHVDRVLFAPSGKNSTHLGPLLDKLRTVATKHHLAIAVAADHYARAVRLVGVDEEMVFVRLVSAVEKMMGAHASDALSEKLLLMEGLTDDERKDLRTTLLARRARARFVAFLGKYSAGFFDGEAREPGHTQVTPENLSSVAGAIYKARSGYLHSGDPMYLSPVSQVLGSWHMAPTVGQTWQDRSFTREQKLPCADFFHRLVRHCILARIDELAAEGDSGL
jgi:hypothetical protein